MAKCIAVVNQKGGVGKTTTSLNLSASLAFYNQSVLLIDLDPQANATSGLGFDKRNTEGTIYDVLLGQKSFSQVIRKTALESLALAPSHIDLIGAEVELISAENREQILRSHVKSLDSVYQYIILDCPPSLGLLTLNALCAADSVIIPVQCEYYAMEGVSQLMDTIQRVKQVLNPSLEIEGVVLTMYDPRAKLANDVINEIKNGFGEKVYQTIVSRNVRLAEAPSFGKPALLYDFASKGSQAYLQLAKEFMEWNTVKETMSAENTMAPIGN